jgi:hypothetical protein
MHSLAESVGGIGDNLANKMADNALVYRSSIPSRDRILIFATVIRHALGVDLGSYNVAFTGSFFVGQYRV